MTNTLPLTTDSTDTTAEAVHPTPGRLRRAGGLAGIIEAACYVGGFGLLAAYLGPDGLLDHEGDAEGQLDFLLGHQTSMFLWNFLVYLVAGAALVVLVLALHERLQPRAPGASRVAAAVGLVWSGLVLGSGMIALVGQRSVIELADHDRAQAASTWMTVQVVQNGLGGGIEIVGGLWVLLLAWAGWRTRTTGRALAGLGLVVGAAGVLTVVPQLEDAAVVFGLGFIAWFAWVGIDLLRRPLTPTRP